MRKRPNIFPSETLPGKKKLNWSNQHMLIIIISSLYIWSSINLLAHAVKHMHGEGWLTSRRRCPDCSAGVWQVPMALHAPLTQPEIAVFVAARLDSLWNSHNVWCQAWLSLNGPQREAVGFSCVLHALEHAAAPACPGRLQWAVGGAPMGLKGKRDGFI